MRPNERAARSPHRKFLERLFTLSEGRTTRHAKLLPSARDFVEISTGISGLHFRYVVGQDKCRLELYIARPNATINKRMFDELLSHKHKIEDDFGEGLCWERLEGSQSSRIAYHMPNGGSKDDEAKWQAIQTAMIDAMVRLEKALAPFIPQMMHLK